ADAGPTSASRRCRRRLVPAQSRRARRERERTNRAGSISRLLPSTNPLLEYGILIGGQMGAGGAGHASGAARHVALAHAQQRLLGFRRERVELGEGGVAHRAV